ncbi:ABC transporter substrate-binding protein [Parasporobacterium paucivorans]|uniref:Sulfonate transport system substrate-binding protein n=1 Tax=Parasporobacterium paucivorans DSM 15970 TaxID=1122934 RepID=A0A1M6E081_9FIRM|nr:ABC transporter substrate-binding protein [Parasporobacterium paucivorans]SHI78922.1 sulfonate transport system substrate-binding protein [Parasporobacterium paucivorans DSM 15970]
MKKKIIILAVAVFALIAFTACSKGASTEAAAKNDESKVVRLGYPGSANFMGGLAGVAQEKKFFDEELDKIGYKIEYVPFAAAGPAVNEALASNSIDVAIYADFPGVVLKSKGVPIDLLGIPESRFYSQILVKSDSDIKSVKDLKGKKIGFTKGTYMQKNLLEILAKNNLVPSDVELVNVTTDAESALISGNLDAIVQTNQGALMLTTTKKVAISIADTRDYPETTAQVIFVGVDSFVKSNPEVAVAMNKALLRAKEYFEMDSEDAFTILTKSGLNLESVKLQYGSEAPGFDLFTVGITEESIRKLQETQKFLIDEKLITGEFDIAAWTDNSYYEKALK